jgi:hypothetical protein
MDVCPLETDGGNIIHQPGEYFRHQPAGSSDFLFTLPSDRAGVKDYQTGVRGFLARID